jgi:hypothetical protein
LGKWYEGTILTGIIVEKPNIKTTEDPLRALQVHKEFTEKKTGLANTSVRCSSSRSDTVPYYVIRIVCSVTHNLFSFTHWNPSISRKLTAFSIYTIEFLTPLHMITITQLVMKFPAFIYPEGSSLYT